MMWIPVVAPTPTAGTVLNFTGPYPQTIEVQGNYTLNPSIHPYENLNIAVIVQGYQSNETKEVFNGYFNSLGDLTSVSDGSAAQIEGSALLGAWPNPSTGNFSVAAQLPAGVSGTVEIFDIAGRSIETFTAGSVQSMNISEAGLYFVRLTTSTGEIVNRQIAIVR
jgi:hypothetical protein